MEVAVCEKAGGPPRSVFDPKGYPGQTRPRPTLLYAALPGKQVRAAPEKGLLENHKQVWPTKLKVVQLGKSGFPPLGFRKGL